MSGLRPRPRRTMHAPQRAYLDAKRDLVRQAIVMTATVKPPIKVDPPPPIDIPPIDDKPPKDK